MTIKKTAVNHFIDLDTLSSFTNFFTFLALYRRNLSVTFTPITPKDSTSNTGYDRCLYLILSQGPLFFYTGSTII